MSDAYREPPKAPEYLMIMNSNGRDEIINAAINDAAKQGFRPLMMTGSGNEYSAYVFLLMVRD